MPRLRVCHVITRLIVGGAQQNTVLSCALADPDRFESRLVTGPQTGSEGSLFAEASDHGVDVEVVSTLVREVAPLADARALAGLRSCFRAWKPDLVHSHSSKAGILGRLAARIERVPRMVHTVHGWSFHDHQPFAVRGAYVAAERFMARWTDRIIVVAESDRVKGLRAHIGRPSQYRLLRSGFDLGPFQLASRHAEASRRSLGLDPGDLVVGTIGRFTAQKDPLAFLDVADAVRRVRADARFVMVGDGPLRSQVEQRAASLGLTERLALTGVRDDIPELLSALDVFVLTSRWEGLPRVVPQAMAAGIPVVVRPVDGLGDFLARRQPGIASGFDPSDLAAAVLQLAAQPELRERVISQARALVEEFAIERMIQGLEETYDQVCESRAD